MKKFKQNILMQNFSILNFLIENINKMKNFKQNEKFQTK